MRTSRIALLASAIVVIGVGIGVGSSLGSETRPIPIGQKPANDQTSGEIGRLRKNPESGLGEIEARMPAGRFQGVRVGTPPAASGRTGGWLYAETVADEPAYQLEVIWNFELMEGAIAEALTKTDNLADGITGRTLTIRHSDRSVEDESATAGDIAPGQHYAHEGDSDEAIVQREGGVLEALGGGTFEVSVIRAVGPSVKVVMTVNDAAAANGKAAVILAALNSTSPDGGSAYEGTFIEIDDSQGALVVTTSSARSGVGRQWTRPGTSVETGIPHG